MHPAVLYEKLSSDVVRCLACAHYCHIGVGAAGLCGVRTNHDGKLALEVYGRPVSVCLDPVEKKPLFHFLPGFKIFSLGTVGCNFGCDFCQNADISQATRGPQRKKVRELVTGGGEEWPPQKIVDYCLERQIPAIAYTYNEPTILAEYIYDTAKLAKEKGIKNVMVSNGYQSPECLNYLAPVIDAINIDLKAGNEKFYLQICRGKLAVVKKNIRQWRAKGVWVEVTTLVVPGRNDSAEELRAMAEFLAGIDKGLPWHLSRFFPHYQMAKTKSTSLATLQLAREIGLRAGLKYVYLGNVPNSEYEDTICPQCGALLIKRTGMLVRENNLSKGQCPQCQEKIEGVWK